MNFGDQIVLWILGLFTFLVFTGCGIKIYPGHPGFMTHDYSKIDTEFLSEEGLYVYETSYDNRASGSGVGAIITKLYRGVQTFTSNVRGNDDGTVFRHKAQYDGAEVQMISLPQQGQLILTPNSTIAIIAETEFSLDEVDDQNIAEQNIFNPPKNLLSPTGLKLKTFAFRALVAGRLLPSGALSYDVMAVDLGKEKFVPSESIRVETNFFQNGIRANISKSILSDFVKFLEEKFPQGYKGQIQFHLKGVTKPLHLTLGLHTIKTAEASGITVIRQASTNLVNEVLKKIEKTLSKGAPS